MACQHSQFFQIWGIPDFGFSSLGAQATVETSKLWSYGLVETEIVMKGNRSPKRKSYFNCVWVCIYKHVHMCTWELTMEARRGHWVACSITLWLFPWKRSPAEPKSSVLTEWVDQLSSGICLCLPMVPYSFYMGAWDSDSGLCACWADTLTHLSIPQPLF